MFGTTLLQISDGPFVRIFVIFLGFFGSFWRVELLKTRDDLTV